MQTAYSVSQESQVTERYIQKLTKKASDLGKDYIACKGQCYLFKKTAGIGGRGWVYSYTQIKQAPARPKKKVRLNSVIDIATLPVVANLTKPTTDEKLALVSFYNSSKHPLSAIVKALIMQHLADIKPSALQTRIKRWTKAYEKGGRAALEDKRGGKKPTKGDDELIKQTVFAYANHHYTTMFGYYCFVYAKKHGLSIDMRNPTADISESAFNVRVKKLIAENQLIKEYTQIGKDAFRYAGPSLGRDWQYPNEQWEIDATPTDIMVKVPFINNKLNYFTTEPTEHYLLKRMELIRIIDNFSGASVFGLYESSNSYADVRLLRKALKALGKPEIVKGDGGSDYVSGHFQAVLADMGITYIKSRTGRGDDKGKIERGFRTVQHGREFESLPGFIGHNVSQRQHIENQDSTVIERRTGVATNIEADYKWWWEIENWLDNFLAMKEEDKRDQHTPLEQDELSRLYRLLGKRKFRKVSSQGIRNNSVIYTNSEMWQHVTIGDRVEVIENIDDISKLFLFKDGQFICEVEDLTSTRAGMSAAEWRKVNKDYRKQNVTPARKIYSEAKQLKTEHQQAMFEEFSTLEEQVHKQEQEIQEQNDHVSKEEYFSFLDQIEQLAAANG